MMRSPLADHYGNKERVAKAILPSLPVHSIYVEPFAGGASLFFAKPKSEVNVLNDLDRQVWETYAEIQSKTYGLLQRVARELTVDRIWRYIRGPINRTVEPRTFSVLRYLVLLATTYSNTHQSLNGSFVREHYLSNWNKVVATLTDDLPPQMRGVILRNTYAILALREFNSPEAFAFIDPPYMGAQMRSLGKGFDNDGFRELMHFLDYEWKGTFALTCYQTRETRELVRVNEWPCERTCADFGPEVLIRNYANDIQIFTTTNPRETNA